MFGKIDEMNDLRSIDDFGTIEAARRLGLAVRSVQLMVDRGELEAWRTPGGHRRISRASVERWIAGRGAAGGQKAQAGAGADVLVIEDSRHFQNLLRLLLRRHDPSLEVHVADDGIAGLAMAGSLNPRLLVVDILLPGIDGATLITGLRTHPQFADCRLIVVTSLEGPMLDPYRIALEGVAVVHKPQLLTALPPLLAEALGPARSATA